MKKNHANDDDIYKIVLHNNMRPHFETIFNEIDNKENAQRFNIQSYNISVSSL